MRLLQSFRKAVQYGLALMVLTVPFQVRSQDALVDGYARLTPSDGTPVPTASALFTLRNGGEDLIAEAAVEMVQPVVAARLFLDQQDSQTGLALVNPGPGTVVANLQLRDREGTLVAQKPFTLPPTEHVARFVNQFFDESELPENFLGSLTFVASAGSLAGVTLRQSVNDQGEGILAALPLVPLETAAEATALASSNSRPFSRASAPEGESPSPLILGHIGAGSAGNFSLSTRIILISRSGAASRGQIGFFSSNGQPLEIGTEDQPSGSTVPFELAGNGVFSFLLNRQGIPVQGYARVDVAEGPTPSATALFQFRAASGKLLSEAGVVERPAISRARLFVDTIETSTGLALANSGAGEASPELQLRDQFGRLISNTTIKIPSKGHMSAFVDQLFEELPTGFTGSLEVVSPTPLQVVSLKLTFNSRQDPILTTLPVADLDRALPPGEWFLPQIGFGPGITTRVLLLGSSHSESTGLIRFFQRNGSPLQVPLRGSQESDVAYELRVTGSAQLRVGNRAQPFQVVLPELGDAREITLNQGSSRVLRPLVQDNRGDLRDDFPISFAALDLSVVSISEDGLIQALGPGFSTIFIESGGRILPLTASVAQFSSLPPGFQVSGLAADRSERFYLSAPLDQVILRRDVVQGSSQVYAGQVNQTGLRDGIRPQALFHEPTLLAIDQSSGRLFVSDRLNHVIRIIDAGPEGQVSTLAGNGFPGSQDDIGQASSFREPTGLALDATGRLWVSDTGNHTIRSIDPVSGAVTTIAGKPGQPGRLDGQGEGARFNLPLGLAVVPESLSDELVRQQTGGLRPPISILVADSGNGAVRQVFENGEVRTISGTAARSRSGTVPSLFEPVSVAADTLGNLFFADRLSGSLFTLLENGVASPVLEAGTLGDPRALAIPAAGRLLTTDAAGLGTISFGPPEISSITPQEIPQESGQEIVIEGANFAPETRVVIAGRPVNSVLVENTGRLSFRTPSLISGLALVSVQNRGGLAQSSILVSAPLLSDLPRGFVTTVTGGSTFEGEGLSGLEVPMRPVGLALDNSGNLLIADSRNNRIRRVEATSGVTTSIAGTGRDGRQGEGLSATAADLNHPTAVLIDPAGNLMIADAYNALIRRVDGATGVLTTIAGLGSYGELVEEGPALTAFVGLTEVVGLAFDPADQTLFFTDSFFNTVREINLFNGTISTRAGGGTPSVGVGDGPDPLLARLEGPVGLAFHHGDLFISEYVGHRVRRIRGLEGGIETLAGTGIEGFSGDDGPAVMAQLAEPAGLAFDLDGNLLIADSANYRVRRIDLQTGFISTVAGDGAFNPVEEGSLASETSFSSPISLQIDGAGNLFIADNGLLQVFRVDSRNLRVHRRAGSGQLNSLRDGPAFAASFRQPQAVTVAPSGDLFVADDGNLLIRRVDSENYRVTSFAGGGNATDDLGDGGPATNAEFCSLGGLTTDAEGNLYLTDTCNHRVRRIDAESGIIQTSAGSGVEGYSGDAGLAVNARLREPVDVAITAQGDLLVADSGNNRIRLVALATGIIRTVAGNGQPGLSGDGRAATEASLALPVSVACDSLGVIYIAQIQDGLERIRRVSAEGIISTIAGGGENLLDGVPATQSFISPDRIALQGDRWLYLLGTATVRRIDLESLIIETVAGAAYEEGFAGDGGPALQARFFEARGIALDTQGNLFIADTSNHRIRAIRGPLE